MTLRTGPRQNPSASPHALRPPFFPLGVDSLRWDVYCLALFQNGIDCCGDKMAISTTLKFEKLDNLFLDPLNPRLGRNNTGREVSQDEVLELMRDWTLDELIVSFLESGGFWTHEAVLVVEQPLYGAKRLVVVEGNRRIGALRYLRMALDGEKVPRRIAEIAKGAKPKKSLFDSIPYIEVDSRQDVEAFLGFRHVTGIKEWKPAEKAEFIAKLIDTRGFDYKQVMRKIGSRTDTVRQNYISYRLLLQIEDLETIPEEHFEERFSVMYLSLRTQGVQKYLQIDIYGDPKTAIRPVPKGRLRQLQNFALWLFGDGDRSPLFSDSRQVDNFGRILGSPKAIGYLEQSDNPRFEIALRTAGGDEPEIVQLLEKAADNIELALTRAHHYKKSKKMQRAVERLGTDALQLLDVFPKIKEELGGEPEQC